MPVVGASARVNDSHRPVTRQASRRLLQENADFIKATTNTSTMDIVRRKKGVYFQHGGGSAKETLPVIQKNERKVLSDNSNITRGEYGKKSIQVAEACKLKGHSTFRATPGNHASRKLRKHKFSNQKTEYIRGPERVVPFDEPMDLDDPALHIRSLLKHHPTHGVEDIDSDKDEFFSPVYAQDITNYLQAVETRWTFPGNYLEEQDEVNPAMRAVLMDWLIQVQCHQKLLDETLHLAVALIDRYVSIRVPPLQQLQLLGITCLLVAAKYEERFPPEMATLCHLTDDTYTMEDMMDMEINVLQRLKFDLNIPGPCVFLDRFMQAEDMDPKINYLCRYLIDISLTSVSSVQFVPSLISASAIFISRRIFRPLMGSVWTPNLAFYTKYSERDLDMCVQHLEKLLAKCPTSKYSAAQSKYDKPKFECISTNMKVYANAIPKS